MTTPPEKDLEDCKAQDAGAMRNIRAPMLSGSRGPILLLERESVLWSFGRSPTVRVITLAQRDALAGLGLNGVGLRHSLPHLPVQCASPGFLFSCFWHLQLALRWARSLGLGWATTYRSTPGRASRQYGYVAPPEAFSGSVGVEARTFMCRLYCRVCAGCAGWRQLRHKGRPPRGPWNSVLGPTFGHPESVELPSRATARIVTVIRRV